MTAQPFIREHPEGVTLAIKLQPRAAANDIGGPAGNELRIRVTAPPLDSAANEALVQYLAQTLALPRRSIQILRGHTSRHKSVLVRGVSAAAIQTKLSPASRSVPS